MVERTHSATAQTSPEKRPKHKGTAQRMLPVQHGRLADELIAYLADSPENRRARQVSEWEAMRRMRSASQVQHIS